MLSPHEAANMARYPIISGIRNENEPRDAATWEQENALIFKFNFWAKVQKLLKTFFI